MTRSVFVTCAERREMQAMRDAGHSVQVVALAFDRSAPTVIKHTSGAARGAQIDDRNDYLIRITKGRPLHEREMIARRFGLANAKSLEVTLCVHRGKRRRQYSEGASA